MKLNTICLPLDWTPSETYEKWGATVAGWGLTENNNGRFSRYQLV